MRRCLALLLFAVTLPAFAGIVGVFQGRIVQPKGISREEGILFIRARNGMARKVKVEKAVVVEYDEEVPSKERRKDPAQALCDDVLVRVTAEQSETDGPWRAINIVILAEPDSGGRGSKPRIQKAALLGQDSKPERSGTNSFCVP